MTSINGDKMQKPAAMTVAFMATFITTPALADLAVSNQTATRLYVATMERIVPTFNPDGMGISPPYWRANGWWTVEPGQTATVYNASPASDGQVALRIIDEANNIYRPDFSTAKKSMCIANQKFYARTETGRSYTLELSGGRANLGECASVGGYLGEF